MSDTISRLLNRILESGEYSDLKFLCRGVVYQVHSTIICPQSKILDTAGSKAFSEGYIVEIDMSIFLPETVGIMVQYLYSQNYGTARVNQVASIEYKDTPLIDARVFAIADQCHIESLKELAKTEFKKGIERLWDSECFILIVQELWKHKVYQDLYGIIEQVVAQHVEQLLTTDAAPLIDRGMVEGMFSMALLRQVLTRKNTEITKQNAQYLMEKSRVRKLKDKIRGYQRRIKEIQKTCSYCDHL